MKSLSLTVIASVAGAASAFGQSMELSENGSREGFIGPSDKFTGTAYIEPVFSNTDPFAVNGGEVTFLPGSRSNWHTHPAGQVLIVTEGIGWVQEEGGEKIVMRPGDVIWTPPGVKHWHGATQANAVTHYAIQQFEDGENVNWMEPVTDEQYGGSSE